jgi:signal transduction histidine kinase
MTSDEPLEASSILIVDDEVANTVLLDRLLREAGYSRLQTTTDPRQVLELYRTGRPDLILLDLLMPHLDGIQVMEQLRPHVGQDDYVPVLVLTADATLESKRRALAAGATDFLTKPFDYMELVLRVRTLLRTRSLHRALRRQNERLEAEVRERTQQLLEAERLATMGNLLAGVAHELNNPLSVILGHAQLLTKNVTDNQTRVRAGKINEAAARCTRIVRNFLTMARRRAPERTQVALDQLCRETVELLAYELRVQDIEVECDLAPDAPSVWADGHQLQQVLVNLITNAQHAMRDAPPPRRLRLTTRYDAGRERVAVSVSDTGPGIAPEIQGRIFEPFFTTKPDGLGTGLGLALCRGFIEAHGGTIRVETPPGGGATFVIDLPLGAPVRAAGEEVPQAGPPVAGRRILVVDDEPDVAGLLAEVLALDGHVVDIAANGADAIKMLTATSYDLIVSDSGMPMLSGPELYAAVEQRRPDLVGRFIFITGDALNAKTVEFLERIKAPRLSKPVSIDSVRGLVREVLLARGGTTLA